MPKQTFPGQPMNMERRDRAGMPRPRPRSIGLRARSEITESAARPSFPRRRESSKSRVHGDMSLFRAPTRKELDSRLRGNDDGRWRIGALISGRILRVALGTAFMVISGTSAEAYTAA